MFAGGVEKESEYSISGVERARVVIEERVSSNGSVLCAAGVEQKRSRAYCGIGISIVEG